jgi:hypothetical protein
MQVWVLIGWILSLPKGKSGGSSVKGLGIDQIENQNRIEGVVDVEGKMGDGFDVIIHQDIDQGEELPEKPEKQEQP